MTDLEGLASLIVPILYPQHAGRMEGPWAAAGQDQKRTALDAVRMVLTALRDPTEEMIDAAAAPKYHARPVNPSPTNPYERTEIRRELQAVIDSVLNEDGE